LFHDKDSLWEIIKTFALYVNKNTLSFYDDLMKLSYLDKISHLRFVLWGEYYEYDNTRGGIMLTPGINKNINEMVEMNYRPVRVCDPAP